MSLFSSPNDEEIAWFDGDRAKRLQVLEEQYRSMISAYGLENVMVLTGTRGEEPVQGQLFGTRMLNEFLKKIANPNGEKIISSSFSVGDIVIARRNDYKDGRYSRSTPRAIRALRPSERPDVFNGTKGRIISVEDDTVSVEMYFPAGTAVVPYKVLELDYYLEPAFAITVHKAQGGQANGVIYLANKKVKRSMFYTAFTRAKRKIVIIGKIDDWEESRIPLTFFKNRYLWAYDNPDNPEYDLRKIKEKKLKESVNKIYSPPKESVPM